MERIKAIVFDWDGTVVDTMPLKIRNASEIFALRYGVSTDDIALTYKKYSGISRRELFNLIARENIGRELSVMEFNKLSSEFTSRNIDSYKKNRVFDDENREVLRHLMGEGYMLFVSSSAIIEEIHGLAEYLKIKKYFTEILASSENFKKGKDHIDYIKGKYGLQPGQIMFVGDEKADMRLSGRLGVMCVGIAHDKPDDDLEVEFADYVIHNLGEIKEIIFDV